MIAALVGVAMVAAGCTGADEPGGEAAPATTTSSPRPQLPEGEPGPLPQVTPQPLAMNRIGDDVEVRGKVELVIDPMVAPQTVDLTSRMLEAAGAAEVMVRAPGARFEDATLSVRIGDRAGATSAKELQDIGFPLASAEPESYTLAVQGGEEQLITIGAVDPAGVHYGVQTLRQLTSEGRIAGAGVVDRPSMPLRGTVEGFYGSPWTQQERLDQLAFYGDMKLNTYIYAPKDDPYHRELWREPYPPAEFGELQELIGQAGANFVKFTFAISPGTSICYSDPADIAALQGKMRAVYDAGVRNFSIALDDITYTQWNCAQDAQRYGEPSQASAGQAQVDLLNTVQTEFVETHPDTAPLQFVPTEYSDMEDSPYKSVLREQLHPDVVTMWTGDGVIPESVTVADAQQAEQVWGRKLFLWDNYPVNDFPASEGRLLVGPYAKREQGLHEHLSGAVSNPMNQAAASKVAETGLADFSWNSADYDPQRAWRAAAEYLAGDRFSAERAGFQADPATVDALLLFFDLNYFSPVANGSPWQGPAPELQRRIDEFRAQWSGGDRAAALEALRGYAQAIADAPETIRAGADRDFTADSEPWLQATDLWGAALLATVDGLQARAEGNEPGARAKFAESAEFAQQAGQIQTVPGENEQQGPVRVADGVLDVFLREAPGL